MYDMPRLSAIRGASLAALYSPRRVASVLGEIDGLQVERVYAGASQGVWKLTGELDAARDAAGKVRQALATDDVDGAGPTGPHSHMAYAVALVDLDEAGGDMVRALHAAEQICAADAMQGKGFPLPAFSEDVSGYDRFGDRTRPADTPAYWPGKAKRVKISTAHYARREFGRAQRKSFYRDYSEGGTLPSRDFVDDFESMVDDPPSEPASTLSSQSKTAIFKADGDGFTKIRVRMMKQKGIAGLTQFSDSLLGLQKTLLSRIVGWLEEGARKRPEAFVGKNHNGADDFRFETLMWGGDEILFVMPAWLGIEFARRFAEWTKDWAIDGNNLTFSGGLVIANHKTPIRQTAEVAEKLIETAKDAKMRGSLQVEIFESLSIPDTDLTTYRKKLYFPTRHVSNNEMEQLNAALILQGDAFEQLCRQVSDIKSAGRLPRSQLYNLLRSATGRELGVADATLTDTFEWWKNHAGAEMSVEWKDLPELVDGEGFSSKCLGLSLAAMLWDYIVADDASGANS